MKKARVLPQSTKLTHMAKAAAQPAASEPQKSHKIPKLAKKNKSRLPRKEKKAQKKASLAS